MVVSLHDFWALPLRLFDDFFAFLAFAFLAFVMDFIAFIALAFVAFIAFVATVNVEACFVLFVALDLADMAFIASLGLNISSSMFALNRFLISSIMGILGSMFFSRLSSRDLLSTLPTASSCRWLKTTSCAACT